MPESKEETKGVKKPPFDPNKLLVQLEQYIQQRSEKLSDRGSPARVGKSWVWSVILPLVVLVGIAVFAWVARRRSRELAMLRHEKNKAKILKDKAAHVGWMTTNDEKIAAADRVYELSKERLRVIEADIVAEEKRHEADIDALHRIRTWNGTYIRHPRE